YPDSPAADAVRNEARTFIEAWRTLWALHGPQPDAVGYRTERDRFVASLAELADDRLLYNGSSVVTTTRTLLAGSALGTDAADGSSPAASKPTAPRVSDASKAAPSS